MGNGEAGNRALQALWPSLASMEHRDDLETLAAHSVRYDVPSARNHEFARPGHPTGAPETRQFRQAIDCGDQRGSSTGCRVGVLAGDIATKFSEMADRPRRPDDGHARGAFRSRFLPQERSQLDTSSCATPRPS